MALLIARYHEITLKRGNRARFAAQLIDNIRHATIDLPVGKIADRHGRVAVVLNDDSAWPALRERLRRVFGIANFSLARSVPWPPIENGQTPDLAPLARAIVEEIRPRHFDSFRVVTRRADKRFPLPSPAVNAAVGTVVKEATRRRVDLDARSSRSRSRSCRERCSIPSRRFRAPAASRSAFPAMSSRCSREGSTRPWPPRA